MTAHLRLLIAEDDPAFRRVIQFTLQRAGWQVTAVPDGGDAINALRRASFDYLVTDHQMPRVSGVELIRTAREDMHLWDLPIILCTAKGLELDAEALYHRFELAKVLHKPFSPRELVEVVRTSQSDQKTVGMS